MKAQQPYGSPQTLGRRVSFWLIAVAVALTLSGPLPATEDQEAVVAGCVLQSIELDDQGPATLLRLHTRLERHFRSAIFTLKRLSQSPAFGLIVFINGHYF